MKKTATILFSLALISSTVWAQAEPAPASYVPPGGKPRSEPTEFGPRFHMSLGPELAVAYATNSDGRVGYGGGVRVDAALLRAGAMRFGVGGNFSYSIFEFKANDLEQRTGHAQFAFALLLDGWFKENRLRPWLSVGVGFSLATFSRTELINDMLNQTSILTALPLVQIAAGLNINIWEMVDLGLRAQSNFTPAANQEQRDAFSLGHLILAAELGFRF